jgi:hypothetical protein
MNNKLIIAIVAIIILIILVITITLSSTQSTGRLVHNTPQEACTYVFSSSCFSEGDSCKGQPGTTWNSELSGLLEDFNDIVVCQQACGEWSSVCATPDCDFVCE